MPPTIAMRPLTRRPARASAKAASRAPAAVAEAEASIPPSCRPASSHHTAATPRRREAATATECLELGLYISFAGAVTYRNKKFEPLRAVAAAVPSDRILIETDSPYLVPEPLRGKEKRNEPAHVVHTAGRLAELRGVGLEEFAAETTANARRLFGLP